jgi:hypothetical protein
LLYFASSGETRDYRRRLKGSHLCSIRNCDRRLSLLNNSKK